jgi:hypothetical protein
MKELNQFDNAVEHRVDEMHRPASIAETMDEYEGYSHIRNEMGIAETMVIIL